MLGGIGDGRVEDDGGTVVEEVKVDDGSCDFSAVFEPLDGPSAQVKDVDVASDDAECRYGGEDGLFFVIPGVALPELGLVDEGGRTGHVGSNENQDVVFPIVRIEEFADQTDGLCSEGGNVVRDAENDFFLRLVGGVGVGDADQIEEKVQEGAAVTDVDIQVFGVARWQDLRQEAEGQQFDSEGAVLNERDELLELGGL